MDEYVLHDELFKAGHQFHGGKYNAKQGIKMSAPCKVQIMRLGVMKSFLLSMTFIGNYRIPKKSLPN